MSSHLGGTRDPMAVARPSRIQPDDRIRAQFTHCIDVAPTILEAVGVPEPDLVDGIAQEPMDGTSFLYSFDDPAAPERHTVQYFEMFGSRPCTRTAGGPPRSPTASRGTSRLPPSGNSGPTPIGTPTGTPPWELYYLPDDFSEARNVAAEHADKIAELQERWWQEAERNRVLPLMGGLSVMFGILPPLPTATRFVFAGDAQNIQRGMIPRGSTDARTPSRPSSRVPEGGAEGVETYKQVATTKLPTGAVAVRMLFESDRPEPGSGGTVTLFVNDEKVGEGTMPRTVPLAFSSYSGMDVGRDNGLVVDLDYEDRAPYAFTGTVKSVVFDLKPMSLEDELALHEHAMQHAVGHGVDGDQRPQALRRAIVSAASPGDTTHRCPLNPARRSWTRCSSSARGRRGSCWPAELHRRGVPCHLIDARARTDGMGSRPDRRPPAFTSSSSSRSDSSACSSTPGARSEGPGSIRAA